MYNFRIGIAEDMLTGEFHIVIKFSDMNNPIIKYFHSQKRHTLRHDAENEAIELMRDIRVDFMLRNYDAIDEA